MKKEDCTQRFTAAQKKSDDSIANPTTTPERTKALKRSLELVTKAVMAAELHVLKRGRSFFGFYEKMLGEASQVKWVWIVETQVGVMPWTDLQGNVNNEV